MKRKHIGSNFDDFLKEEGILSEVQATAATRVIAYQITQDDEEAQAHREQICNAKKVTLKQKMLRGR